MRINKFLSESGIASRRGADKLIEEGRVKVNGKTLTSVGVEIEPDRDTIMVDGVKVKPINSYTYIMFNKPKGCVTTLDDSKDKGRSEQKDDEPRQKRKTVYDYLTDFTKKVRPIGRLDYDSEGLLLFTNDGDLIYKLTHPANEIPKTYGVTIEGHLSRDDIAKLCKGVVLDDGTKTGNASVVVVGEDEKYSKVEITITEGKNREIRRMLSAIGYNVTLLRRVAVGELRLGGLSRGKYRYLTEKEIKYLKNM